MKRLSKLIILVAVMFCTLSKTLAYYNTNTTLVNNFFTKKYNLNINGNGGVFSGNNITIKNNKVTLPKPERYGYEFLGYMDENNTSYSTNINNVNAINNKELSATWNAISYSISYNLNGGTISQTDLINYYTVEKSITLPTPEKTGYTFTGWTGTGLNSPTKNVTFSNSIGNRNYTANWTKNYYTVNYYVNGSLWAQRSIGYNDGLPNLNGQDALDGYHKFNGWSGWVDNMPDHDVSLTASVTECYCRLITGHGPYGNASGLLSVFQSAGWTGTIQEQPLYPGNYLVITDYTLTRTQAEAQKNYIASHTNYTNYNFPYLYWVAIDCTNGYSASWTRGLGQSNFN